MVVRNPSHSPARLGFELLEDRRLLSLVPQLVRDINPVDNASSAPSQLTEVNGTLFFTADDGINGRELWKSDGTSTGTALVKDIQAGSGSSSPSPIFRDGGRIYFTADDGTHGGELWISDGTTDGTVLVKDILPGNDSSVPTPQALIDGNLLFTARHETGVRGLWRTDGTAEGTVLIEDFQSEDGPNSPQDFLQVGENLFFSALEPPINRELWKSDGTVEGTALVKDVSLVRIYPSFPTSLTNVGGILHFVATQDGVNRYTEIWKTDGTNEGTQRIIASGPSWGDSFPAPRPRDLTDVNGELFYSISDSAIEANTELYKGSELVKDIRPGSSEGSDPSKLTNVEGILFFTGDDGTYGRELWKSDGTEAGTVLVKDIRPGAEGTNFVDLESAIGVLFFVINHPDTGRELWRSDGTSDGTFLLKDIQPGSGGSDPALLASINGILFFSADDGTNGRELWMTDGNPEGTLLVGDIQRGDGSSNPSDVTVSNGIVFFTADDGIHGRELWKLLDLPDLPGDTNDDGRVSLDDLNNVRNHFGDVGPGVVGDTNGDGVVNVDDLNNVLNNFGLTAEEETGSEPLLKITARAAQRANADLRVNLVANQQANIETLPAHVPATSRPIGIGRLTATDRAAWRKGVDEVVEDELLWWRVTPK